MVGSRRVVLIGGAPGAGKTTLGRAIAAALGWPSLTGDDLVVAIRAMTTPEERPELFPMSPAGHTRYFTDGPPERLVTDAILLEEALWPALERVTKVHAALKESIVIDWWLLPPAKVVSIDMPNVSSLWIHMDPEALRRREEANTDFLEGSEHPEQMLANFMHRSLWRNELVKEQASRLGLPLIHQPGDISTPDLVAEALGLLGLQQVNRSGG